MPQNRKKARCPPLLFGTGSDSSTITTESQQALGHIELPHVDGIELCPAFGRKREIHLAFVALSQTSREQLFFLGRLDDLRHIRRRKVELLGQLAASHARRGMRKRAQQHALVQSQSESLLKAVLKPHDTQVQFPDVA